jgi:2-polyprenyl-6-methoxyphenol hydroxylase-like FAD-dependent oxidoreductase
MKHIYDIAVLGATSAGCAAACHLARHKCDVALIDTPQSSVESPLADWAPRDVFQLKSLPRTLPALAKADGFKVVRFHNSALTRRADHKNATIMGYFFQASNLCDALRAAAIKAGAEMKTTKTAPAIRLEEEMAHIIGTVQVSAKILIVAYSRPNDIIGDLSLPVRTVPQANVTVAALDVPLADKKAAARLGGVLNIVEMPERTELGMFFMEGNALHLRVISSSRASGNRAAELSTMVAGLQRAGILPPALPLAKAKGAVWTPPAGVALELETHVAKRCLLAGTAGGFADSVTGQTVCASVQSAILAADAAMAALKSRDPQETLMTFKSSWRKTLAERLRPPNTSLHMLLPLLFVNANIVPKVSRALLYGESI